MSGGLELHFVGTASATPSRDRGYPAQAVVLPDGRWILVDCGEGTVRQLLSFNLPYDKLAAVLITHHHADHIGGLSSVLFQLSKRQPQDALPVWGSPKTLTVIRKMLIDSGIVRDSGAAVSFNPIHSPTPFLKFDDVKVKVSAFTVPHAEGSLGYRFDRGAYRPFSEVAADYLEVPPSLWDALKRGDTVSLPNGEGGEVTITPDMVSGDPLPALSIAITGDIDGSKSEVVLPHIEGVQVLVTEATCLPNEEEFARASHHSTLIESARLIAAAHPAAAFVTHITPRNSDGNRSFWALALDDALLHYPDLQIAHDGLVVKLLNQGSVETTTLTVDEE